MYQDNRPAVVGRPAEGGSGPNRGNSYEIDNQGDIEVGQPVGTSSAE